MKQKANFYEKQEPYKYMRLGNGKADVFIREFIEESEEVDENGRKTILFVYNQNEFRVNENEITEEMIKENPLYWIDYNPNEQEISLISRLEAIEGAILELGEMMFND